MSPIPGKTNSTSKRGLASASSNSTRERVARKGGKSTKGGHTRQKK